METKAYNLDDFIKCCGDNTRKVIIYNDAQLNARIQFGLNTEVELLMFIGNGGLQDLDYINTEPWRNNPRKNVEVLIDAYTFRSNSKMGYIAFMKTYNDNYAIKSFHLDNNKITTRELGSNSNKLTLKEGL